MNNQCMFITADEIRKLMGVSRAYAYKLIKQLNAELEAKGFIVVSGKTNRQYFNARLYCGKVA